MDLTGIEAEKVPLFSKNLVGTCGPLVTWGVGFEMFLLALKLTL
jgi:hypothetical protein